MLASIKVRTHNEQATHSGGFFVRWLGHPAARAWAEREAFGTAQNATRFVIE